MDQIAASSPTPENETTAERIEEHDITPEAGASPSPDSQSVVAASAQQVMRHLSTAENETLLVLAAVLAVVIYIIFGRLGLLFIGLVAGFLFHEYWDGVADNESRREDQNPHQVKRRKELSLEVASRLLEWNARATINESDDDAGVVQADEDMNFSKFRPATAAALSNLTDAILRDYVNYWYNPILSSENSFPLSCRKVLVNFINSLSSHMTRKRSADTFLQFVTNSSSMIIVFLHELSTALQTAGSDSSATEDVIKHYLESYPDSSLSNVLSVEQQQKKLKMVAEDVLSGFLEPSVYKCEPLRTFFREIFAGVVLESVIQSCSKPDFINGWIVYLLQEGEPEIMNAIDAGLENAPKGKIVSSETFGSSSQSLPSEAAPPLQAAKAASDLSAHDTLSGEGGPLNAVSHAESSTPAMTKDSTPSEMGLEGTIVSVPTEAENSEGSHSSDALDYVEIEKNHANSDETKTTGHQDQNQRLYNSLLGASVSVDDGSHPGEKAIIKSQPTAEYSLLIEPASSREPGWMTFRSYQDFEYLHEALTTLSRYHHVSFLESHAHLPHWRGQTRFSLARSLEKYLGDALKYEELVQSDRLRRFFGRDSDLQQTASAGGSGGNLSRTSSTFENMGKGVLGVLSNAPKGVAGGGKAVLDGMTGVFSGLNKRNTMTASTNQGRASQEHLDRPSTSTTSSQVQTSRISVDQPITNPLNSPASIKSGDNLVDAKSKKDFALSPESSNSISTDSSSSLEKIGPEYTALPSNVPDRDPDQQTTGNLPASGGKGASAPSSSTGNPITDDETRIAVELIFAVINELYTLSSAWNIRKTLLNAAKTYILRPGNPHLESIRVLVQESMIDANTSDDAIAANISKTRENALPTPEEIKLWPPPLSKEESEKLRVDARKLLIERGMPQALISVMGGAATKEALARVFDCLQVEEVARGFMFALILQALRAIIL